MAVNDKFELEMVNVKLNHDKTLYSDTSISSASEAVEFLKNEMEDYDREHFVILNLNTKAQVINASVISIGDLSMALVHPREVFKASILSNAASVIMLHNHPSGIAEPSDPDRQLTTRLVAAGKIMGVRVLDHIVVGRDEYYSFASEGLIEDMSRNADDILRDFLAFEEEAEYSTDKKASFRDKVAEAFITSLEEDPKGWVKKWASNDTGRPFNMASGRRYNGLNAAWLKFVERERGYTDPRWLTFNQVKKMNEGREADDRIIIPKGTKMTPVEYFFMYDNLNKKTIPWNEYNALSPEEKDQRVDTNTGEIVTEGGLFGSSTKQRFEVRSRDHYVFNASQLENMPEYEFEKTVNDIAPSEVVNRVAIGMGVSIMEAEQDRAYYVPELDRITLPLRSQFESDYDYQSTALHELGHATGHSTRLNRNTRNEFGSPEYAYEELIAEMTSAFMGEYVESPMNDKDLENHAAYIQDWIKEIKSDKNYLFRAIKEADKAADYMVEKGNLEELKRNVEIVAEESSESYMTNEPENLVPMPGIERLGEFKKEHSRTLREFLLENQNSRIELRTPDEVFFLTRGNIDEYLSDEKHNNILEQEIISTRNQKDDWGFESIVVKVGEELSASSDNISIDGHDGTWYVVAVDSRNGEPVFELEHEEYGDEAAHLIVDRNANLIYDDIWNGFDDMRERDEINKEILENAKLLEDREVQRILTSEEYALYKEAIDKTDYIPRWHEDGSITFEDIYEDQSFNNKDEMMDFIRTTLDEMRKADIENNWSPFDRFLASVPEEKLESVKLVMRYLGDEFNDTDEGLISSFDDMSNIGLAYSTDGETGDHEIEVKLSLENEPVLRYFIDGEHKGIKAFSSYEEFNSYFSGMDFGGLVSDAEEYIGRKEMIVSQDNKEYRILSSEITWQEGSLKDGNFIYGQRFESLISLQESLKLQDTAYRESGNKGYDKTGVKVAYITPDNMIHYYEDRYDVGDGLEYMNLIERLTNHINHVERDLPFELTASDKDFIDSVRGTEGYEQYSKIKDYLFETGRVKSGPFELTEDEYFIINKFEALSEEVPWDGIYNEEPIIKLLPEDLPGRYEGKLLEGSYYMSNPAGPGYAYFKVSGEESGFKITDYIEVNDRALGINFLNGRITYSEAKEFSDKMYQKVKDYLENNIKSLPEYLSYRDDIKSHLPGEEENIGKLTTAELMHGLERGTKYDSIKALSESEQNILYYLINDFREDFALDHKDYDERFSLTMSLLDRISNFYFMKDFDELKENPLSKEEVRHEGLIKSYSEALIDGDYAYIERTQNIIVNSVGLDAFKEIQDKALDLAYQDEGYRKRMADEDREVPSSEYSSELPEDVNEESTAYQEDSLLYRINDELKKLNYEFVDYNRLSDYTDDKHLSVVVARNLETGEYTTWGYNSESGGLYHGHYNIPSEREAYVDYYERMQEHLRPPYRVAIYSGEYTGRSLEKISNTDVFEDGYSNRKILAYVDTEEEGRALLGEFVSSSSHNNSSDEFVTIEQVALELLEYDEDGDLLSNELIAYTNKPVEYDRENRSIIIGIDDTGNYVAAFTSEGGYNGIIVPFNGIGYISGFNDFAAREIADKYDAFHELIKEDYMRANDALIKLYLDNAPDLLDSSLTGSLALTKAEREFVKDFFDAEIRRDMTDESISINLGAALVVAEDKLSKERSDSIGIEAIAKESSIKKPQKDKDSGAEL